MQHSVIVVVVLVVVVRRRRLTIMTSEVKRGRGRPPKSTIPAATTSAAQSRSPLLETISVPLSERLAKYLSVTTSDDDDEQSAVKSIGMRAGKDVVFLPQELMSLSAQETLTLAERTLRRIVVLEAISRQVRSSYLLAAGFADIARRADEQLIDAWTRLTLLHRRIHYLLAEDEDEKEKKKEKEEDDVWTVVDSEEERDTDDEQVLLIRTSSKDEDKDEDNDNEEMMRLPPKKRARQSPSSSLKPWYPEEFSRRMRSRVRRSTDRLTYTR